MTEFQSLITKLAPFMTARLQDPADCFVITAPKDMATLLLFRSHLEYIQRTSYIKWHFKAYFDDRVSTLNDQPMQAADFSRLGTFIDPMMAGLQTGHVSLIKGRVS